MRVDLPAPFSPQIAWISPRPTDNETFSSALTPGKVLVMERISRMKSSMDSVVLVSCRAGALPAGPVGAGVCRASMALTGGRGDPIGRRNGAGRARQRVLPPSPAG